MSRLTARLVAVVLIAMASIHAQTPAPRIAQMPGVSPAMFKGLKYRLVGPSRGGRVTTVTGVPSQPATFYMGAASGGLFRTTDSGATWTPIADGKIPVGSMGSIAVADSDPDVIYVGTGSDGVRSNVSTGRGVYKTTDAGATWTFAGLYNAGQIGALRIHPADPNIVWVAAMGDAFKPNADRGIFKTTDGGATWKKTLFINDTVGAMDVEIQPGHPNVVYAWMSRLERKPWTIISGGKEGGFYKSTDGGETFTKITNGLPTGLIGKANLAVTAARPDRIYALIEALPGAGFYRSDDAGQTWANTGAPANTQASLVQRPFYYTTLGADPTNGDVVYAGAESFFKSSDGGKSFTSFRTPHGDNHDIWISPKDGNIMIQSNDGGANVSTDGGRTWSSQNNQVTAEIYGVTVDNEFPFNIYAAQQDTSYTLIMTSQANPMNLADWHRGPGCETGPIVPKPNDPNVVYGSCKGQYEWMNMKTGQSKNYWIGGQSLYGNPSNDLIYRFQRVSPMATSPWDPEVLYYGSQYLHRTRDKGVTWEKISPDLTAHDPCCQAPSGEPITRDVTGEEFYSTLYAITESPIERGVIWTGANDGPVSVTRDNGKTWETVTPKDLPPGGRVQWIDVSPHRRGSAYLAVYRYLLGDYQPYLYRTDDYGKTWKRLTDGKNGIPADWPTRVVREDPDREGLLYAGTEFGMFISFDNGAHWQSFQLNLPATPVTDIKVYQKNLIVSTQGRSIWMLDNITPLHQLAADVPSATKVFKPRDGYKTRTTPERLGPQVDYYVPATQAQGTDPVVIEILDAKGGLVNRYSSAAATGAGTGRGGRAGGAGAGGGDATAGDPDAAPAGGRGGGGFTSRVTRNEGMNRFVWDLRHQNGLSAPPGNYQVRVTSGGGTFTQPLTVLVDPNLAAEGLSAADLQAQFDHNVRMRELVALASQTVARVRAAQAQLKSAPGADAAKAKQVDAIAAQLLTEPVRYGKPGLQAHISYLAGMTSGADQKVGKDALDRYAVLKKELDAIVAQLDQLLGK
ncbi:MAG TPA: hypothetical protein VFV78_03390 [Vicinamibacterales bacterium]|nr:hypothetical protein [Vicinamibacterales bacterium]